MKDFLMIFKNKSYADLNLSQDEAHARMGKWFAWQTQMESESVHKTGNALHGEVKRMSGKDRTVTDHASAEIKELIGGYYIVKAENADEVVKIAQAYPETLLLLEEINPQALEQRAYLYHGVWAEYYRSISQQQQALGSINTVLKLVINETEKDYLLKKQQLILTEN